MNVDPSCNSIVQKLRFSDDIEIHEKVEDEKIDYFNIGLEVKEELIPNVYKPLLNVCNRLNLDFSEHSIFIYPESQIQASCINSRNKCIIRISSGAVQKLNTKELEFIIGHEFGHYLLYHPPLNHKVLANIIILKAREISCDRIGLYACCSLDACISAIIKTQSGLDEKHLNIDIAAYINSATKNIKQSYYGFNYSTHPSLPVRARALFWANESLFSGINEIMETIKEVNKRIKKDILKYENYEIQKKIDEIISDNIPWVWVYLLVTDNKMTAKHQEMIASQFGNGFINKLINQIKNMSAHKVHIYIENMTHNRLKKIQESMPLYFNRLIGEEVVKLTKIYNENKFDGYMMKINNLMAK